MDMALQDAPRPAAPCWAADFPWNLLHSHPYETSLILAVIDGSSILRPLNGLNNHYKDCILNTTMALNAWFIKTDHAPA
jgi:hypothetical protein